MTDALGKRLSTVRKERGLSQRELAKRAGVTNSTISLIEQDRVSPSVSSLKKILDGFPMTMAEFFTRGHDENAAQTVFGKHQQPNMGQGEIEYFLIGAGRAKRQMALMRECYQPDTDTGADMIRHEGEEGGVVISGKLELTVGDQVQTLSPGDGYYFDSRLPHRFRNISDEELTIVSASCPPTF